MTTRSAENASVVERLGLDAEIAALRQTLGGWIADAHPEIRAPLEWQFQAGSKYFRPLTIFSCYRAVYEGSIPPGLVRSAAVLEMFHNMSLVIDDILDRSTRRRGVATLHTKFGMLTALMTSGYIVADGYRMVEHDQHDIRLLSELLKRLGVAECQQWRLRRQPLGVDDWLDIASEDTGSMFEVCACLGTRTDELRRFGHFLGVLYHGCDDVGDVRGAEALGGGGDEDVRDGILTLPAALAIRDPGIAKMFCDSKPSVDDVRALMHAFRAQLPEAEAYLDQIAEEARRAANTTANPQPLLVLIEHTRQLSTR